MAINHKLPGNNKRSRVRTMKPLLVLASAAWMVTASHAFATRSTPSGTGPKSLKVTDSSLSFSMVPVDELLSFTMAPIEEVLSDSSLMQDEFYNGMTHALLDFSSLWGSAATRVRLATVIGRVFLITHDVQTEVLPDELVFQLGLLAVACHGLATTLVPKFKAKYLTPALMTSQDRQAFRSLFRPAGISWSVFKELHLESMDWVHLEPGHVLWKDNDETEEHDHDAVYWLYDGNVQVWSHDTLSHSISGRQKVAGLGLLGEGRLANLLGSASGQTNESKTKKPTGLQAVVGESGATLLRMNTTKLEKMLKHDQDLTHAIHRVAFMGMQDKLDALLVKEASS